MPIHPQQVECEACGDRTQMDGAGQLPPGWIVVEARETVLVERDLAEPEFPALDPQAVPAEILEYVGGLQQTIVALASEVADRAPATATRRGLGVYCPQHAGLLQTRIDFPEKDEWIEEEGE